LSEAFLFKLETYHKYAAIILKNLNPQQPFSILLRLQYKHTISIEV